MAYAPSDQRIHARRPDADKRERRTVSLDSHRGRYCNDLDLDLLVADWQLTLNGL